MISDQGYLTLQEPAAGAGGMILAYALVMKQRGYDPSSQLFVSAVDISSLCYWMAYLQLTLAGIPAQVIQGNSLSLEIFEIAWTASAIPFLGRHGDIFNEHPSNHLIQGFSPLQGTEIKQLSLF